MATPLHTPSAPAPAADAAALPRIWAIGGGKGGVGKSVVTTNLAAAMASDGRRVVVVDADLGGANLHTLLGVSRPRHSISQLFSGDAESLEELLVQTSVPNLWLVSGHQALLEMANPRHAQKEMVFRQLRSLDVDDVVLDLGAGSSFTVLDFFLQARRGIVVVTPEPTAIENAEHFLRAAFHRSLRDAARRPEVAAVIGRIRENRAHPVHSASELIALVRALDPPAAKPLEEQAQAFAPLLLVNQAQTLEHRRLGAELVTSCRERLGIVSLEYAGCIDADRNVGESVARRQPALQAFPLCRFAKHVEALAERLQRWEPGLRDARHDPALRVTHDEAERLAAAPAPSPLPPFDPAAPGASLRLFRETLGLTLPELTDRTRIRILDDIEQERFDRLPPDVYLKGYLFEVARELGVSDVGAVVNAYLARRDVPEPAAAAPATPAPPRLISLRSARRRFRRRGR